MILRKRRQARICTSHGSGHPISIRRSIDPLRYCRCILRLPIPPLLLYYNITHNKSQCVVLDFQIFSHPINHKQSSVARKSSHLYPIFLERSIEETAKPKSQTYPTISSGQGIASSVVSSVALIALQMIPISEIGIL